jgi:hypothetical protein
VHGDADGTNWSKLVDQKLGPVAPFARCLKTLFIKKHLSSDEANELLSRYPSGKSLAELLPPWLLKKELLIEVPYENLEKLLHEYSLDESLLVLLESYVQAKEIPLDLSLVFPLEQDFMSKCTKLLNKYPDDALLQKLLDPIKANSAPVLLLDECETLLNMYPKDGIVRKLLVKPVKAYKKALKSKFEKISYTLTLADSFEWLTKYPDDDSLKLLMPTLLKAEPSWLDTCRIFYSNNQSEFTHSLFPTPNHHHRHVRLTFTFLGHIFGRFINNKDKRAAVEKLLKQHFTTEGIQH